MTWLGAVQAQDYLGALVGRRVARSRHARARRRARTRRTQIVRTWPMRGTLHFVGAADARWMTELLGPRRVAAAASRFRSLGIDEAVLARARLALVKGLEGGRRLTRPDAYRVLERAKIATGEQRGLHVLWRLAHDCLLCFGPREGKQHTFVLFDEWLPEAKRLPREEALAELAARYFTGHGPATLSDFAWWSGLRLKDARLAIALAGKRLEEQTVGGKHAWVARSTPSQLPSRSSAYLLPAFDEFLVGYADSKRGSGSPAQARREQRRGDSQADHGRRRPRGRDLEPPARPTRDRLFSCAIRGAPRVRSQGDRRCARPLRAFPRPRRPTLTRAGDFAGRHTPSLLGRYGCGSSLRSRAIRSVMSPVASKRSSRGTKPSASTRTVWLAPSFGSAMPHGLLGMVWPSTTIRAEAGDARTKR